MTTLKLTHPALAAEWHPNLNAPRTPDDVTHGSRLQAWWQCQIDPTHAWQARVNHRVTGASGGCQVCSGRLVVPGVNGLSTQYPRQAAEWHPTRNGDLRFDDFKAKSPELAWWRCTARGHVWQARIISRLRTKGSNCPECMRISKVPDDGSLADVFPELVDEWDTTANLPNRPTDFTPYSGQIVAWRCALRHSWRARIVLRTRGTSSGPQGCPICSGKQVLPGETSLAARRPDLAAEWHPTLNLPLLPTEVPASARQTVYWQCAKQQHTWATPIYARSAGNGCPHCSTNASRGEAEVADWLTAQGVTVVRNTRHVLDSGMEIDIWVPAANLGIEYNGIYWHSDAYKDRTAHQAKYLAAQRAGIRLVQIWEDDWQLKPAILKLMLAHLLRLPTERTRVAARSCDVREVTPGVARTFLDQHHLQGFVLGTYLLGLYTRGATPELVAVMVLHRERHGGSAYTIRRYATAAIVQGGFGKLLAHAERTYQPTSIITFSDNLISAGDLYAAGGFQPAGDIPVDYAYVARRQRHHKFNYRKARFEKDPDLSWRPNLSERALADLNGLNRVWDAGKIRWVRTYPAMLEPAE